ncbi:MAG TPA: 50S ribosomal protein L17 [Vicinamibacterales bacterium]|nr:50S ribosomal protein L17 [Vicinamibacterales bacterium]
MRHRVAYRKLGRVTEHRISMLRNQSVALLRHERIQTTVARAKELRPFVERIITIAKRSLNAPEGSTHGVTARRAVARDIADRAVVSKLFETIAPRYVERPGGYTRLLRLGHRRGDNADVAEVELLGSEYDPNASGKAEKGAAEAPDKPKKKTMGGRLREALGGRKKPEQDQAGGKGKVDKAAKGAGKKITTPRKAGGS